MNKRYEYEKPNFQKEKKTDRTLVIITIIVRIILTPIFLVLRIYDWVWSMDYYNYLKHHKD